MKTKLLMIGLLFAGNALAFHSPADMKSIDDALAKGPALSAEQLAEVKRLRAEGETLHKAGKHQASVDTIPWPKPWRCSHRASPDATHD
ncbi:hypothetical protein [Aeromonas salmonicida]|uniref:hypothetical protein n=1 Tax=Aeromonas salmonicida TaxID=645 RepID=UPI000A62483E|nr:hypothetical protein [Aeromonas salmonicida]MDE7526957.1 hypothetical protein [Aeromonas salmonicida]MDE7531307.1 hypothetical protein [Aeromonas salmonicida]